MRISRCRYWRCVKCQEVQRKKDLAEILRRYADRREGFPTGRVRCSRCDVPYEKEEVYAGTYDAADEPADRDEPAVEVVEDDVEAIPDAPASRKRSDRLAPSWVKEEPDQTDKATERKRSKARQRRRGLGHVNIGLAIHYGGMVGFMLGQAAAWLAVVLLMIAIISLGARKPDASSVGTLLASGFLFFASWVLTTCSALADLVSAAFCLRAPDAAARGFLIGALAVRVLALPAGLGLILLGQPGWAMLATSVLATIGWVLWVLFLRALALDLSQPDLAKEVIHITFAAVKLAIWWMVVTVGFIGFLALMAGLKRVGFCGAGIFLGAFVSGLAGFLRYLIVSGRFESITTLLLYPTGIPLIMRYLDLIGTLRMIILRRS
jgi:hypothetical protein